MTRNKESEMELTIKNLTLLGSHLKYLPKVIKKENPHIIDDLALFGICTLSQGYLYGLPILGIYYLIH